MRIEMKNGTHHIEIQEVEGEKMKATLFDNYGNALCGVYKPKGTLIEEVFEYFNNKINGYAGR